MQPPVRVPRQWHRPCTPPPHTPLQAAPAALHPVVSHHAHPHLHGVDGERPRGSGGATGMSSNVCSGPPKCLLYVCTIEVHKLGVGWRATHRKWGGAAGGRLVALLPWHCCCMGGRSLHCSAGGAATCPVMLVDPQWCCILPRQPSKVMHPAYNMLALTVLPAPSCCSQSSATWP